MSKRGSLTIVYGAQYGSEGKGQICAYLATNLKYDLAVRVGGPNAGHTFLLKSGKPQVVQSIPTPGFFGVPCVIGAAGFIILDLLEGELQAAYRVLNRPLKLAIDENAVVIDTRHMQREGDLMTLIGSTGEGVGAASADKIMRRESITVKATKISHPAAFTRKGVTVVKDTPLLLNKALHNGKSIIVEGTQGVDLSLHTSGFYPFCTSRECTPQGILAQAGIAPWEVQQERIMVVRTYPIRVAGNSGDLPNELTWEELAKRSDGYIRPEITTVTKNQRRIAEIDYARLRRNVTITRPTAIALTFFDYWFPEVDGMTDVAKLKKRHWESIAMVETELGVPIKYLSTGFGSVINLRVNK